MNAKTTITMHIILIAAISLPMYHFNTKLKDLQQEDPLYATNTTLTVDAWTELKVYHKMVIKELNEINNRQQPCLQWLRDYLSFGEDWAPCPEDDIPRVLTKIACILSIFYAALIVRTIYNHYNKKNRQQ